MAVRVLSTEEARIAIVEMKNSIERLTDEIQKLNTQGTTLSQPEVWDGMHAISFRNTWPEMHSHLDQTLDMLAQLTLNIERINLNIITAGGD